MFFSRTVDGIGYQKDLWQTTCRCCKASSKASAQSVLLARASGFVAMGCPRGEDVFLECWASGDHGSDGAVGSKLLGRIVCRASVHPNTSRVGSEYNERNSRISYHARE